MAKTAAAAEGGGKKKKGGGKAAKKGKALTDKSGAPAAAGLATALVRLAPPPLGSGVRPGQLVVLPALGLRARVMGVGGGSGGEARLYARLVLGDGDGGEGGLSGGGSNGALMVVPVEGSGRGRVVLVPAGSEKGASAATSTSAAVVALLPEGVALAASAAAAEARAAARREAAEVAGECAAVKGAGLALPPMLRARALAAARALEASCRLGGAPAPAATVGASKAKTAGGKKAKAAAGGKAAAAAKKTKK